jgi:molybdopterin synthase sulfur carrier subunit
MTITVKFFASLREELGRNEATVTATPDLTVADVWKQSTAQHALPANILSAINQEYADLSRPVKDGDEVAFFPPVTGG